MLGDYGPAAIEEHISLPSWPSCLCFVPEFAPNAHLLLQPWKSNRKQIYFSSWRAKPRTLLSPRNPSPSGNETPGASGVLPRPTRDLWTELSENFMAPRLAAETRPPTPPPTHCFSCASRSLTSASRLFTRATSSSSRSCSRRFWASVFCQSAEDGRLVTHPQSLGTPSPASRLFQFPSISPQTTLESH